jgi:hypothetical protein
MNEESELLWRYYLERYFNAPLEQRSEAFDVLISQGAAIVPWLGDELVKKREGDREAGQPGRDTLHLAALLVELGDPRSLVLIFNVGDLALLGQLLETLVQRAAPEDIQVLMSALEQSAPRWQSGVLLLRARNEERVLLAESLVKIAEQTHDRACGRALPLLRYHLLAPREFLGLHKRLKAALKDENLPIPTTTAQRTEDLPIPSEGEQGR